MSDEAAFLVDVLLHESLPSPTMPEIAIYNLATYRHPYPTAGRNRCRLPVADRVIDLGRSPPIVATPLLPRHPELIKHVCDRLDLRLEEYSGCRFTMSYPLTPSLVVVRYPLATPSDGE